MNNYDVNQLGKRTEWSSNEWNEKNCNSNLKENIFTSDQRLLSIDRQCKREWHDCYHKIWTYNQQSIIWLYPELHINTIKKIKFKEISLVLTFQWVSAKLTPSQQHNFLYMNNKKSKRLWCYLQLITIRFQVTTHQSKHQLNQIFRKSN